MSKFGGHFQGRNIWSDTSEDIFHERSSRSENLGRIETPRRFWYFLALKSAL